MEESTGHAFTRTGDNLKAIQEYTDCLWTGVQKLREWLHDAADLIREIQEELNALTEC